MLSVVWFPPLRLDDEISTGARRGARTANLVLYHGNTRVIINRGYGGFTAHWKLNVRSLASTSFVRES